MEHHTELSLQSKTEPTLPKGDNQESTTGKSGLASNNRVRFKSKP